MSDEEVITIPDSGEVDPTAHVKPKFPTLRDDESESSSHYSPQTMKGYEDTLDEWRRKSSKMAFIYDYVGDKYRQSVNRSSITAFVLSSCITLLALGNLGLSETDYPIIAIVLKAANALFGVGAVIATGLPRLLGWNIMTESCQKYLDSVENLLASIMSEQALPVKFRTDPEQYILEKKEKYQAILDSAPHVSHDDYIHALDAYEQQKARLRNDLVR